MKPRLPLLALACLALTGAAPPKASRPVVVELFTSQGCSSCPPANAVLADLADRPDVIALSFSVTYWDQLGWKDSFASPKFTNRQWDYARGLGHGQVWTPQMVVDGRDDTPGQSLARIEPLIAAAKARKGAAPAINLTATEARISAGAPGVKAADVWLARYDPHVAKVPVRAGENAGRTLPHRNVVRELVRLGEWTGAPARFQLPQPKVSGLASALLVQSGVGGPILAAEKFPAGL